MEFIQAKHYRQAERTKINLVVIHTMESPEGPQTAKSVARWFASTKRRVSAHYNIDSTNIVRSVHEKDVAFHAPGANHNGIGLEHAGYLRQSPAEWNDPYSAAMLQRSAELVANIASRRGLPIQFVDAKELRRGRRGITTHAEVSLAWGKSDHMDPGPSFPMSRYLATVRAFTAGSPLPPPPPPSSVMQLRSSGAGVRFLQDMLNILRPFHQDAVLVVDGTFGQSTHDAVVAFQRFAHTMSKMAGGPAITVDGKVGAQTAAAIAFWVPAALKRTP